MKKIMAMVLVIVLVVGMLPMSVLAVEVPGMMLEDEVIREEDLTVGGGDAQDPGPGDDGRVDIMRSHYDGLTYDGDIRDYDWGNGFTSQVRGWTAGIMDMRFRFTDPDGNASNWREFYNFTGRTFHVSAKRPGYWFYVKEYGHVTTHWGYKDMFSTDWDSSFSWDYTNCGDGRDHLMCFGTSYGGGDPDRMSYIGIQAMRLQEYKNSYCTVKQTSYVEQFSRGATDRTININVDGAKKTSATMYFPDRSNAETYYVEVADIANGYYAASAVGSTVGATVTSQKVSEDSSRYKNGSYTINLVTPRTLTLNYNDGKTANKVINTYYKVNVDLPTPSRVGYTFLGWGTAKAKGTYNVTKTETLVAQWSKNPVYTIVGHVDNGGYADPASIEVEKATGLALADSMMYFYAADGYVVRSAYGVWKSTGNRIDFKTDWDVSGSQNQRVWVWNASTNIIDDLDIYVVTVAHPTHNWNETVTLAPACEATGLKDRTCTICNKTETGIEIPATGHAYGAWTQYGNADQHRKVCGNNNSHVLYENHNWTETGANALNGEITRTYECTVCHQTKEVKEHVHSYDTEKAVVPSTCKTAGYKTMECSCGDTTDVPLPLDANNHEGETETRNAVTATCKTEGYSGDVYCLGCNQIKTAGHSTGKNASNHEGGTEVRNAVTATCKTEGYTGDTYCKGCNQKTADGHSTGKDASNHEGPMNTRGETTATCKTEGKTAETYCTACGVTTIPGSSTGKNPSNHEGATETRNAKTANCHEQGYTGDVYCLGCGQIKTAGETIAINADNHDGATETRNAVTATCKTEGYSGDVYCLGCNQIKTAGHSTGKNASNHEGGTEVRNAVTANCHAKGYTGDVYCLGCETKTVTGTTTAIDADNHDGATETRNAKTANCHEQGYTGDVYCLGCNQIKTAGETIAINADNHNGKTEIRNAKTANCHEQGYTGDVYCLGCNQIKTAGETIAIDIKVHDGATETRNAKTANCHEQGYTGDVYCLGCETKTVTGTTTVIDSTNHDGTTEVRDTVTADCVTASYTGDTYCLGCETKIETGTTGTVNADNHKGGYTWTDKGENHAEVCSACNHETGKTASHTYSGEWITRKDATYTEEGEEYRLCTACEHEATQGIDKLVPSVPGEDDLAKPNGVQKTMLSFRCVDMDGTPVYNGHISGGHSVSGALRDSWATIDSKLTEVDGEYFCNVTVDTAAAEEIEYEKSYYVKQLGYSHAVVDTPATIVMKFKFVVDAKDTTKGVWTGVENVPASIKVQGPAVDYKWIDQDAEGNLLETYAEEQHTVCVKNVADPADPTKTNYEFLGWNTEKNFNDGILTSVTKVALWNEIRPEMPIIDNARDVFLAMTCAENEDHNVNYMQPANLGTGYQFSTPVKGDDGKWHSTLTIFVDEVIERFNAKEAPSIHVRANDQAETIEVEYVCDNASSAWTVAEPTATKAKGTGYRIETINVKGAQYTYTWMAHDEVIGYQAKSGCYAAPDMDVVVAPIELASDGRPLERFIRWDEKVEGTDITWTAVYETIVYVNVAWMNGYTDEAVKTVIVEKGTDLTDLYPEDLTRDGYFFNGWGRAVTDSEGNITITAQWLKKLSLTVKLVCDSTGDTITSIALELMFRVGQSVDLNLESLFAGKLDDILAAHTLLSNATQSFTFTTEADGTVVFHFTHKTYTVTWVDGLNGNILDSEIVNVGAEPTKTPAAPEKTGYSFTKWTRETDADGNVTITANYTKLTYTVTFVSNGGTAVEAQTVEYNETATEPSITRETYTFGGWYTDAAFTNAYNFANPVTADVTLYAQWTDHQHRYGEWTTTKNATCEETGSREHTCDVCNDTVSETIPATEHDYRDDWTVKTAATCTVNGEEIRYCHNDAGHTETRVIPAAGHEAVVDRAVAATCTETGLTEGSHCSVCGATLVAQNETPVLGHTYNDNDWTDNGAEDHIHTCTRCGKAPVTEAHSWSEWIQTLAPSYTAEGSEKRTCDICGRIETRPVAMLSSDPVIVVPTTEPTEEPTEQPTTEPSEQPTTEPTEEPTAQPTEEPSEAPSAEPNEAPTTGTTEDLGDEELDDEDVPLAELPDMDKEIAALPAEGFDPDEELEDLDDSDVPLAAAPETGDMSHLWLLGATLSALGLGALALTKKKEEEA